MPEGATIGILIIVGVVVLAILITFFGGRPASDSDEQDVEHLDHEVRGDNPDR